MPSINLPLVKPEIGTNMFTCPNCQARCETHRAFVEHFTDAHVPEMTPPQRGPVFTAALTPQAAAGGQVACPICQRKFAGSDYPAHATVHAGGGLTVSQFNQGDGK